MEVANVVGRGDNLVPECDAKQERMRKSEVYVTTIQSPSINELQMTRNVVAKKIEKLGKGARSDGGGSATHTQRFP